MKNQTLIHIKIHKIDTPCGKGSRIDVENGANETKIANKELFRSIFCHLCLFFIRKWIQHKRIFHNIAVPKVENLRNRINKQHKND